MGEQRVEYGGSRLSREIERGHQVRLAQAGQLLSGVAHEIKNPLAVIQGYAQLLHDRCAEPTDRRDLRFILDEAQRLSQLVDDMLAFTRPESCVENGVDLGRVVTAAVNLSTHSMKQARITVVASLPDEPLVVRSSHATLVQVLLNLLSNARQGLEHAPPEGRGVSIRVERRESDRTLLFVANNGPPIPADVAGSIFDPFFTTRNEGLGLGLALCREFVERYGGSIRLEPSAKGAPNVVFRVELRNA